MTNFRPIKTILRQIQGGHTSFEQLFSIFFTEANETHEYSLILEDTPGLPIGAQETDFEKGSANDDNVIEDGDAIVLDAEGTLFP